MIFIERLDLTIVLTCITIFISLILDLDLVLQKSPYLIQEMVSCVGQLIAMAKAGRSKWKRPLIFKFLNQILSILAFILS